MIARFSACVEDNVLGDGMPAYGKQFMSPEETGNA